MTPNQVELVAQAFYATEYSGDWDEAPDVLREHYRVLARAAIAAMQQHIAQQQSFHLREKRSGIASGKEAIQLLS